MKTTSRIFKAGAIIGLVAVMVGAPSAPLFALDQPGNTVDKTNTTKPVTADSRTTCTRIMALSGTSKTALQTHLTELKADFSSRLTHVGDKKASVDQKVTMDRNAATTKFETKIATLEEQNELTPAQLQAIETFKTNILQAKTAREAAVDSARAAYRAGLESQVASHQTDLQTAVTAYQMAIDDAFATAEAHCTDGTALATLKTAVKTARENLTQARQSDKTTGPVIKQLVATRNAAIKAANTAFSTAVSDYAHALAASLKS